MAKKFQIIVKSFEKFAINIGGEIIYPSILERKSTFDHSLQGSDILQKEMFYVSTSGKLNNNFVLRPEGTSNLMRATLENHELLNKVLHFGKIFYYYGPMFRDENPQFGRYRSFNQFGIEHIGKSSEPLISDIQLLLGAYKVLQSLNINFDLCINSIGSISDRYKYNIQLKEIIHQKKLFLDFSKDSQRKIVNGNFIGLFDSKEENDKILLKDFPPLIEALSSKERLRFEAIQKNLKDHKINFLVDHSLVRGLYYYNDLCFEFTTKIENSNLTLIGGGRYDQLYEMIGYNKKISGIGLGVGIDRVALAMNENISHSDIVHILPIIGTQEDPESLQNFILDLIIAFHEKEICYNLFNHSGHVKDIIGEITSSSWQFSNLKKSKYLIIIGTKELESKKYRIKNLESKKEYDCNLEELINIVKFKK